MSDNAVKYLSGAFSGFIGFLQGRIIPIIIVILRARRRGRKHFGVETQKDLKLLLPRHIAQIGLQRLMPRFVCAGTMQKYCPD